jgi:hypothetical protein
MNYILATILLARNEDTGNGGWIRIIVLVVLGLMYVLGGLAKMKANKDSEKEKEEFRGMPKRQPRYKPLEPTVQPRQAKPKRTPAPRPGVSRITPRPARQVRRPSETAMHRQRRHIAVRAPEVQKVPPKKVFKPPSAKVEEAIPSPVVSSEIGRTESVGIDVPYKQKEKELLSEEMPVLDFSDLDTLRKAIIHYEILGKPLSLREPKQQIWEV